MARRTLYTRTLLASILRYTENSRDFMIPARRPVSLPAKFTLFSTNDLVFGESEDLLPALGVSRRTKTGKVSTMWLA